MSRRSLWWLLVVGLGVLLAYAWSRHAARVATPAVTRPAHAAAPGPEVPIQDRKTIDFSSGRPVVKDSPQEQALIDAAVKEMDAATKDITFPPTTGQKPPPPAPKPAH